jgi:hypothetical protein
VGIVCLALSLALSLASGFDYYLKCRRGLQYRW